MIKPTAHEINPHNDLDGIRAEKNFLGKNLDEAETLFRNCYSIHQEDLLFMGPVAFRFYVQAAIQYIKSSDAKGDSDIPLYTAGYLKNRLEFEPQSLIPIAQQLADLCGYIVEHWSEFEENRVYESDDLPSPEEKYGCLYGMLFKNLSDYKNNRREYERLRVELIRLREQGDEDTKI